MAGLSNKIYSGYTPIRVWNSCMPSSVLVWSVTINQLIFIIRCPPPRRAPRIFIIRCPPPRRVPSNLYYTMPPSEEGPSNLYYTMPPSEEGPLESLLYDAPLRGGSPRIFIIRCPPPRRVPSNPPSVDAPIGD